MKTIERPNLRAELLRLKDFQRDTVEYVYSRMYEGVKPARRFLIADEVGLGKTLVARGIVARIVDRLWDEVPRIDVVYVCSNSSIARQNINRLNMTDVHDAALPTRITLLPMVVQGLKHRRLNFISLTPKTSFDLRSDLGKAAERALLFWLLPETWRLNGDAAQRALQGYVEHRRFRDRVKELDRAKVDVDLASAFHQRLASDPEIERNFAELCDRFKRAGKNPTSEDREAEKKVVGRLRLELAMSCLGALEPDLIILDEFQRFKHLLDGTDQAGDLARGLFTFKDARVLMLSATPYKMYTATDEPEGDDHYRDFMQTARFLYDDENATSTFKEALASYRTELLRLTPDDGAALRHRKETVQSSLRQVMVRTERLSVTADRNGMLVEVPPRGMTLEVREIETFLALSRVAKLVEHDDVIEYWKSAPYLLNFMDEYQYKQAVRTAIASPKQGREIATSMASAPQALLSWDDVEAYRRVDPANARLRALAEDISVSQMWRLLWLPPSLPYYRLAGAFEGVADHQPTKRLAFSSWQVVPKVAAALLSYEAERQLFGDTIKGEERPNSSEARERRRPLLRFARAEGRLTGLPVAGLLYPSIVLAQEGDPRAARRDRVDLTATEMIEAVAIRLASLLEDLPFKPESTGAIDERWYWAAPVLLDLARHPKAARDWLRQTDLAAMWQGSDAVEDEGPEAADDDTSDAWHDHVEEFRRLAVLHPRFGPQPADLPKVLAALAVGGPGIVALRALARLAGPDCLDHVALRNEAGWIAWGFRSLFNGLEVTAMIRDLNPAEPYWLRVAEYCANGCIQAVLDEYAHVLLEWEGVAHRPVQEGTRRVARRMSQVLQLRTATLGVDELSVDVTNGRVSTTDRRMRLRFAARFGARQTDEGAGAVRQDDVRAAFNSPFWPFVLCSTSVGQEGLDFHLYCHAIVHWNLPNNPVDLEQREGRIHRYKGHAVRKNLARVYGNEALASDAEDPWEDLFTRAVENRPEGESELTPYWVFPLAGGACIERHVPVLPLSRDAARAETLRQALAIYRIAFGQSRQDDLVAYLQHRLPAEQIPLMAEQLRIDLSPPKAEPLQWTHEEIAAAKLNRRRFEESRASTTASSQSVESMSILTPGIVGQLLDDFCQLRGDRGDQAVVVRYLELLDSFRATVGSASAD